MSLNVKLLEKVKKHILAKPERLRMSTWIMRKKQLPYFCEIKGDNFVWPMGSHYYGESERQKIPDCDTVGCIAGWTTLLGKGNLRYPETEARKLLGIEDASLAQALFLVEAWPEDLEQRYYAAKTQRSRAKIVGERIDRFIKDKTA